MKKLVLFILLAGFITTANAQKQTYQEKKAKESTEYIAKKMKLNKGDKTFLHDVLLEKFQNVSEQIKGNDLSKEEKESVYKESYKETLSKLAENFSKDEIQEVFDLLKEFNKNSKK